MLLEELNIIFNEYNKTKNDFDLFIETGSYVGETIGNIKSEFNKLISIEITEKYSDYCRKKFIDDSNVEIVKGDSLIKLPKIIEKYQTKRIIFYLDGHYSAGDTGKNHLDCPLIEELKIVNEKYSNQVLIIIDDADLFEYSNQNINWSGINEKNISDVLGNRVKAHSYIRNKYSSYKKRLIIELNSKV